MAGGGEQDKRAVREARVIAAIRHRPYIDPDRRLVEPVRNGLGAGLHRILGRDEAFGQLDVALNQAERDPAVRGPRRALVGDDEAVLVGQRSGELHVDLVVEVELLGPANRAHQVAGHRVGRGHFSIVCYAQIAVGIDEEREPGPVGILQAQHARGRGGAVAIGADRHAGAAAGVVVLILDKDVNARVSGPFAG